MAVFTEVIKLEDGVSGPAKQAAGAFDTLSKALANTEKQMVRANALGDRGAFDKASAKADKFKSALSELDPVLVEQGRSAGVAAEGMGSLAAEAGAAIGVLAAVAAAVAAVVVGFGALVFAGAKFAISSSEAKNASIALFEAMGQGVISGEQVDEMLDDLRATTGLTKDSLAGLTTTFLKMGVTGEDALKGLTVAAASAEALAKGGGQAFATLYEKIEASAAAGEKLTIPFKKLTSTLSAVGLNAGDVAKSMGITTEALVKGLEQGTIDAKQFGSAMKDAVTKKGAGPMKQLANSAANLGKLLEEYLGDLFEDLGDSIAPFMAEVKSLFSILDQANPAGQSLKNGIGLFFKEVFRWASVVVPMIKHFLLDVIILGLKAYIAIKPIAESIKKWATEAENASMINTVINTIIDGFKVLATVLGVIVAVAAVLLVAWGALTATIAALGYTIMAFVGEAAVALAGWVASAATAASDFVAGLVGGILGGAGAVVGAVTGLASKALNAFTGPKGTDSHSPSKKMMKAGGQMTDGVVVGLEDGEGDVHGASSGMAQRAVGAASSGGEAAASSAGGKGGNTINVTVAIDGAGKDALGITQEMVSAVFEQMALQAGV